MIPVMLDEILAGVGDVFATFHFALVFFGVIMLTHVAFPVMRMLKGTATSTDGANHGVWFGMRQLMAYKVAFEGECFAAGCTFESSNVGLVRCFVPGKSRLASDDSVALITLEDLPMDISHMDVVFSLCV